MELRPIIEAAALRWNEAFESAGFRNAVVVRTQPDDADWDAGDLRYNVIRWVSSPSPQFGGYGPSFSDPRTGQILGADIMLEHRVISSNVREALVFGAESVASAELLPAAADATRCYASLYAHREMLFANAALEALGADTAEKQRLLEEFIYFLVLHEIGHTLGLNHNFRSSHLHSLDAIFDPAQTYRHGSRRLGHGLSVGAVRAAGQDTRSVLDDAAGPLRPLGADVRLLAGARGRSRRASAARHDPRALDGARSSRSATMPTTCALPARPSTHAP